MNNIFKNSVVFITGADGGIGKAFVAELLNREVQKIYVAGINILNGFRCYGGENFTIGIS